MTLRPCAGGRHGPSARPAPARPAGVPLARRRALAGALADRGRNSHSQHDHVGGNHRFERILGPGGPFAARDAEGGSHEAAVWKTRPGFDRAACRTRPWTVTGTVLDRQVLRVAAGAPPGAEQDGVRRHDLGWFSLLTAAP
jgi:hypothetical protein